MGITSLSNQNAIKSNSACWEELQTNPTTNTTYCISITRNHIKTVLVRDPLVPDFDEYDEIGWRHDCNHLTIILIVVIWGMGGRDMDSCYPITNPCNCTEIVL